jgi:hypothetical protein
LINNDNYFLPLNRVSITSKPTREQDVIALFNQFLAGGVIRGIQILSTNERFKYDGIYKYIIDRPIENHLFDKDRNPLGIEKDYAEKLLSENDLWKSHSRILEYKYSLDGLIEDIENGDKNTNQIDLVVVWETGNKYRQSFLINSLLDYSCFSSREFHGQTHEIISYQTHQKEMKLIVLSDLVRYLNNPKDEIKNQMRLYEDEEIIDK